MLAPLWSPVASASTKSLSQAFAAEVDPDYNQSNSGRLVRVGVHIRPVQSWIVAAPPGSIVLSAGALQTIEAVDIPC
jgi:hypothetical protein